MTVTLESLGKVRERELAWKGVLACVDPSKPGNNTGVAYFYYGELLECKLHTDLYAETFLFPPAVTVIELPFIYPGARNEDPQDLIQVARAVGQWEQATRGSELIHVYPRTWKGTIKKNIMCNRIKAKLTDVERGKLPKLGTKIHNVLDAIGIGLWLLGR